MRRLVLHAAAWLGYVFAVAALAVLMLLVLDRLLKGNLREPRLYSLDIYPYTGFQLPSHFAEGALRSGDHGFFIDFAIKSPPPKAADEYRIVLIGGSAAMGVYLPSNDATLAQVLERLLNEQPPIPRRFTVINMAMAAAQTYQNFIALNQWGHRLEPDLILSFSGGRNDIIVPHLMRSDLPWRFNEVMGLVAARRPGEGPPAVQWLEKHLPNIFGSTTAGVGVRTMFSASIGARQHNAYVARNTPDGNFYEAVIEPTYLHALRSIKRDFDGIPITIAFQPIREIEYWRSFNKEWMEIYVKMRVNVTRVLTGYGNGAWSFLDVHQLFADQGLMTAEFLMDDCHMSPVGNRKSAEMLRDHLATALPAFIMRPLPDPPRL